MEAGARSDMDSTSSGPHQVPDQTQFNLFMEYACDGIADVILYFQFKMNCSWLSQWDRISGFCHFCRFTLLLCRGWFTNSIHGLWQVYVISFLEWSALSLHYPLPSLFFFPPSFLRGSFLWLSITWRSRECAWSISDYIGWVFTQCVPSYVCPCVSAMTVSTWCQCILHVRRL